MIVLTLIGIIVVYMGVMWALTFAPGWMLLAGLLAFYFCLLCLPAIRLTWKARHDHQAP